ncbi:MAG: RNA polymerase sigma factor [Gemmataceae bacterium]
MSESVPSKSPTDQSLLARVMDGSQVAAGVLVHRYSQRLLALTRAKCGTDITARVDAEDIVQSAFGSFFRGAQKGNYSAPEGEELWNLLLVITVNKIRAKAAHHRAAKRDVRRTVGDAEPETFEAPTNDESAATLLQMVIDEVLSQMPEGYRIVVQYRLEGYEVAEIAAATKRSKRSVERMLQEFRQRMATQLGDPSRAS